MEEKRIRKYDIGHGVTITDDGYSYIANWKHDNGIGSTSIGIARPIPEPGETVQAVYSVDESYFYVNDFAKMLHASGFWLGLIAYPTREAMQSNVRPGVYGHTGASFNVNGRTYFREVLHFNSWKVTARPGFATLVTDSEIVKDYMALAQNDLIASQKRFDEAIAFTGRNLAWIHKKIGPWVPFTEEPVIKLE